MQGISSSLGKSKIQPNSNFIHTDVRLNCNTISSYTIQQHTIYVVKHIHTLTLQKHVNGPQICAYIHICMNSYLLLRKLPEEKESACRFLHWKSR